MDGGGGGGWEERKFNYPSSYLLIFNYPIKILIWVNSFTSFSTIISKFKKKHFFFSKNCIYVLYL